jgi:hypothetical protein
MKILIGVLAVGLAVPASAGTIYCEGSVVSVYVSSSGEVVFQPSYRADYTEVCNLDGSWQGISTEICYSWYSQLIAAKTHAKNVLLQYSTSYTCATLPTYAGSPVPGYVMVTG